MAEEVELKRGLRDVFFDNTESSNVIGDIGRLIYRGYDIHDLAEESTIGSRWASKSSLVRRSSHRHCSGEE